MTSTPATSTRPPVSSAAFGRWSSSSHADAIATTGASSTHGTDSHLALVRAGLGIALVPRLGRQALGVELVAVPAQDPEPTRDVIAVHRRSMADSPAVLAVLAALRTARTPGSAGP